LTRADRGCKPLCAEILPPSTFMNRKHQARGTGNREEKPSGAGGLQAGRLGNKQWKAMGSYGTIGLEFVLSIMLGLFGGRWLDGKLGTGPWLAVIGFAFGLAAGFRAIWRAWKEMQAITRQEEQDEGNPAPMYPKKEEPDAEEPDSERPGEPDAEEPDSERRGDEEENEAGDKGGSEDDKKPSGRGAR
jgi:ATP synthase protein I